MLRDAHEVAGRTSAHITPCADLEHCNQLEEGVHCELELLRRHLLCDTYLPREIDAGG